MKYWLIAILALFLLAGCDIPSAPAGTTGTPVEMPELEEPEQPLLPDAPTTEPVPEEKPSFIPKTDTPSSAEELGVKIQAGTLSFKSPELKEGQWATYKVTVTKGGETRTYERNYEVITFFHRGDKCIGIERNSTRPGEILTQTMWCDDTKHLFAWNDRLGRFNDGQNLGDAHWSDQAIQGMETKLSGLHEVSVAAGTFWTLKRESWDGLTQKTWYGSPLVPGFESGLVKRVETSNSETIVTELVAYG